MLEKLMNRFRFYSVDPKFYQEVIDKLKENDGYKKAVDTIIGKIRATWSNQKIDWFITYVNENLKDGITKENNLEVIYELILFASRYGVRINYDILAILLEECPLLDDILASIIDGTKCLTKGDIISICSKYDYRDDLINIVTYYAVLKGKMITNEFKFQSFTTYPLKNFLENDVKIPSYSEERELLIKAKRGDLVARDKLVYNNIPFILKTSRKYYDERVSMHDLIQEGVLGLLEAIDNFDLNNENSLLTFAKYYIDRNIRIFSTDTMCCCTSTSYVEQKAWQIINVEKVLENKQGIDPTIEVVAQATNISPDVIAKMHRYVAPTYQLEETALDTTVGYDEKDINNQIIFKEIAEVLNLLPEDKRNLFKLVVDGINFADIGKQKGKSRQSILIEYKDVCATVKALMCLKGYHEEILGVKEEHPRYLDYVEEAAIENISKSLKLAPEVIEFYLNQEIDSEVWWAYKCEAISEVALGYFAFIPFAEVPVYLRKLLTYELSFKSFKKIISEKFRSDPTIIIDDLHKVLKSAKMN